MRGEDGAWVGARPWSDQPSRGALAEHVVALASDVAHLHYALSQKVCECMRVHDGGRAPHHTQCMTHSTLSTHAEIPACTQHSVHR